MLLRLKRSAPQGLAVRGKLYQVTSSSHATDAETALQLNSHGSSSSPQKNRTAGFFGDPGWEEEEHLICETLEHRDYLILPLYYRLTVTYSPRFKRPLPLVNQVPRDSPFLCSLRSHDLLASSTVPALRAPFPLKGQGGSSSSAGAHQGSSAPPATASCSHQLPEQGTRSGIRFHPGTKPEHSKGCILVPDRAAEDRLRELILSEKETWIEIN